MALVLASLLLLTRLSTAPPHLTAIVTLMRTTGPLHVILLIVLFAALLARLRPTVKLALSLDELLDSKLRLFLLQVELLDSLL